MRLKPVPEPPADLDALREFRRAVPLVPGDTDDCCARLRRRCDLPDRQTANDWLAFLRALDLVEETARGFVRADAEPTPERVREGLREEVLLVPEALAALDAASPDDPLTAADLFAATRERVPRHDRARDPDWEATWRDRAARLLGWLALVDLAAPVGDGPDIPESERGYVAGDAV
ncbi:hypothetical protein C464_11473 [Halorubrum coriense DSM 10284]|uniref:Uncharacterized protein n=1 Tax=Halorubrum coriense DSM 10284 TaxID=1227466 RepID=M0EGL4_9EURY|nr:hypothetical protein [Halorubrum coriense]ELZ46218.1 hypothetical protein C464_11473 [Halorubrum coriense DSM 10284]